MGEYTIIYHLVIHKNKMSVGKSFSYMVAAYNFSAEILRVHGNIENARLTGGLDILTRKYFTGKNSMFNLKYQEVGDVVDDVEIITYYNKIGLLPAQYRAMIFDNDYIKNCTEIKKLCGIH